MCNLRHMKSASMSFRRRNQCNNADYFTKRSSPSLCVVNNQDQFTISLAAEE